MTLILVHPRCISGAFSPASGFFTGGFPVKNPLAGQTSDFHASCGKISMDNFQKENNMIAARSRDITTIRKCDIVKVNTLLK
jgi:hypothetical protein